MPTRHTTCPVGTLITKTFFYPTDGGVAQAAESWDGRLETLDLARARLAETRLLVRQAEGWEALAYVWRGAEAWLSITGAIIPLATDPPGRRRGEGDQLHGAESQPVRQLPRHRAGWGCLDAHRITTRQLTAATEAAPAIRLRTSRRSAGWTAFRRQRSGRATRTGPIPKSPRPIWRGHTWMPIAATAITRRGGPTPPVSG